MRFVHRIGLRATSAQRRELESLGVTLPTGIAMLGVGDPLIALDVDEDHPSWSRLRDLFEQWQVSDVVRTEFSKHEIDEAPWLELSAWHHGYPQPDEDEFGYRHATYDLGAWCEQCGVGKKQKAPFQMKGEPRWGRRGILQLTWIYDELFVTPQVWSTVFRAHDIACRPVMGANGAELKTAVQLVVEEEVALVTDHLAFERCATCNRVKYLPVTRGAFPPLAGSPSRAVVRSNEYFGSGAQADKRVLVTQDVARGLAAAKVRGVSLTPVTYAKMMI